MLLSVRNIRNIRKQTKYLTLEGPCIIFCSIYIHSNEIHNVVALVKFVLVLRYQLYVFRTVTVHPQEPLCRYCMCRLIRTYQPAHTVSTKRLLRMDRYGPKHVELIPEY